ncbi:ABC transporter permease [Streptococcus merionis]|uniref:ABC transporter permease n=1 Tax=Streptococcus merionis TaxID=400065 RepID=UPI0026F0776A|nr:ABC transporter permease [Streptococcus merionis]
MNFFNRSNRILLREMIKTDFKLRYQGSLIGYLWSILKPLLLFTVQYFVFVRFLRLGGDVPHFPVALLLGMVMWSFFQESTAMGLTSIVARGDLLRKLNFSKQIIVLSSVANAAINFGINLLVVMLFTVVNGVPITVQWLWIVPLFLELALLSTGVAFLLSTLFVKYRDIGPVWEVIMQAGMYATPIIYSLSYVLNYSQKAGKLIMLNPMAQMIQDARHLLIHPANITTWNLIKNPLIVAIPYLIPVVVFIIGLIVFNKNAKRFAEIL